MKRQFAIFLTTLLPIVGSAADLPYEGLELSKTPINRADIDSIKRGAKFFATNCMSCHTLRYLRYDKLANEAGITYDKMPLNVKTWPLGVTPPDLSLEAEIRGPDWIYTYLHSFYQDAARPNGVNNLLVPNTAMAGILVPYQGEQIFQKKPLQDILGRMQWYSMVQLTKQGTMTPEEFDATTADVVNFLAYAAEPYYLDQHRLGKWVLAFLAVLFVLMFLLKREYWRDVKKHKQSDFNK